MEETGGQMQCSPVSAETYNKNKTCFSLEALQRLAATWNQIHKDHKIKIKGRSRNTIWKDLNIRLKDLCSGNDKESCWVDSLKVATVPVVAKNLRPSRPASWDKNPSEWLSNIDIENVMFQYNELNNGYNFLGVFAIDFAEKDQFGKCLYEEICSLNIFNLSKKKIKYVGLITNLDKHDEPGSHWTSTFMCIDPYSPSFGAYYYDSVSRAPPKEMEKFMNDLKSQATHIIANLKAKTKNKNNSKKIYDFRLAYNKKQDQYGNNECGMFSMYYQMNWLKYLNSNPNTQFEDVIAGKISDKMMNDYRNVVFRKRKHIKNNTV
jgi:hypothetical protein